MSSQSAKTRQEQLKYFESAITQRIELLKAKVSTKELVEKDPVLRHLRGKATQIRRSLNRISSIKEKKSSPIGKKKKGKNEAEKEAD